MQIEKAMEITDAKITFVSLVDKAANNKRFLITKAKDGTAEFSAYGKIIKVDKDTHYITGIVYEPLTEDAHGNFMTATEIQKAAYWFAKNGDKVDLQHSFETAEGVSVVETYVSPCEMQIGDTPVTKGTWLITVEVSNPDIWDAVQKGKITGFSMGGAGKYSKEDIDLEEINKTANTDNTTEKKSLFKKLADIFGYDVVEKGALMDEYKEKERSSNFWNAFYALENVLHRYNRIADRYEFESDEKTIREALSEFSGIVTGILTEQSVTKALAVSAPIIKSGKAILGADREQIEKAYNALAELTGNLGEDGKAANNKDKEEVPLTKNEIQEMITAAITKSFESLAAAEKSDTEPQTTTGEPAADTPSLEEIQKMIESSIEKAVAPILKSRSMPSNLNDEPQQVTKSSGVFDGFFCQ